MLLILNTMSKKFIKKASKKGTTEFDAVETLLKGLEIDLPRGNKFKDNYDEYRRTIRVKWWEDKADTYREYALVPKHAVSSISTNKLPKNKMVPAYTGKEPVFFGHYWFSGKPKILKNNIACLDYSVAHKEKLVCYQWNKGDKTLSNKNFAFVDASLSKK